MNTGNRHDNDRDFPEDLDDLARQWQTRAAEQPPAQVDHAVLRAARAAVDHGATRAWPWTHRWSGWLATGAVAAVAVTLLLNLQVEPPTPADLPRSAAPPAPAASPERPAALSAVSEREQDRQAAKTLHASEAPDRASVQGDTPQSADITLEERAETFEAAPLSRASATAPSAEAWLEHIQALQDASDPAWRDELARFQARWPDHPLPETLADNSDGDGPP